MLFIASSLKEVMEPQFTSLDKNNSDLSDELVKRCKKGDQKAQLQVYKLYYRPVFRTCMQIVNDPATAEDIMHESFILAFENINSYIGDISFSAWVKKFITIDLQSM
jgi:DNA-directed RNA polymerase specialized sigma24 family protein